MADHLREAVSRNKRRYKGDGYNLDLSYIEPTIIAMGYPAENIESIYRNQLEQVAKFLNEKHPNHYKIYNLCKEKKRNNYPKDKFTGVVCEDFSFKDHAPPPLENIEPFCRDVQQWLSDKTENVVVVHCKAGKGRTGVMICCYLLHCGRFDTAEEVLQHYAKNRTVDEKGVTIPSQRRYVEYYAKMKTSSLQYKTRKLVMQAVCLENIPFATGIGISPGFTIYCENRKQTISMRDSRYRESKWYFVLSEPIELSGDVCVAFHTSSALLPVVREKVCAVCFNTFFVDDKLNEEEMQDNQLTLRDIPNPLNGQDPESEVDRPNDRLVSFNEESRILRLNKIQLDKACKIKEFPDNAGIRIFFQRCSDVQSDRLGAEKIDRGDTGDRGECPVYEESSEEEDDTSCVRM